MMINTSVTWENWCQETVRYDTQSIILINRIVI